MADGTPSSPLHLVGVQPEAERRKAQVVEALTDALEAARAGRYDSILLVADLAERADLVEYVWTSTDDLLGLVGRLEKLKFNTLRRLDPQP